MEFASRTVGMTSLMGRYDNIMKFFTRIQSAPSCASDLKSSMLTLEVLRLRLSRWGDAVGLSGDVANLKCLGARAESRKHIYFAKEILDTVGSRFEELARAAEHHAVDDEDVQVPDSDSTDHGILIRRLRGVSNDRLCNSNTLEKGRRLLKFDRFCHRSFRRQCKLSMAQVKWTVDSDDHLKKLITDLVISVRLLELKLESMCPGRHALIPSLCDIEVRQLIRNNPISPAQLALLKDATMFPDTPFEDAILREEKRAAAARVQSNNKGTAGSSLKFDKNNRF